ncbi:putative indole-3-acetic acid-amido synthetase GH3.9 isoform X1 [Nicotiana tomentosiformis]|uniref:putative indole-3-acetic acid-amido synthetase GH3.9 isoform X1 n=1 Tax=Nicotiana tomentosiformis TaxID=4098 RepID=UPI00051B2BE9|nr:putative indole-3-acetic acid-amido synthetase GH3.9 isoform X1 [Nicotiana tomentosiformis]
MNGKKLEYKGKEAMKEIESLTKSADEVQEGILREILFQNGETEYLKKFMGSKDNKQVSKFKSLIPTVTYEEIQPYILRIANGEDSNLISAHPITEMLCSSGTSGGEPKLMPSIAEDLDRRTFLYNLIMPIMNQYIPGLDEGKAMFLYFVKAEMSTPCGIPARTVLTSYYKSKHFKCRSKDPYNDFTSPDQAILCYDSNQSMYCQLLAGLVYRHQVLRIGAVFASALLRAISFLQRNWQNMCHDIRTGQLNAMITDVSCRSSLSNILSTLNLDSDIDTDEIEEICGRSSWKGIICQLWPKAKYIEAVVTGSMSQYIPALEYYSEGKLPLICTMYASSECYFGVNLKPLNPPDEVSFTLLPNMAYFEFIPLGANGTFLIDLDEEEFVPQSKLVDLVHVRLGYYYELVITTFSGLYRYRIGDVLQVTGFHNKAPQFRFICRRNVVLSIDNDKTNEQDLHRSITLAKKLLEPHQALLVEYTSYADASSLPGHYVLYWEIVHSHSIIDKDVNVEAQVLEECCIAIEEQLDYIYRRCRTNDKSVGPLEIRLVKPGTFEALMDLLISQGGSINQYKTPRCIMSNESAFELLNSTVKASYFSPREPSWSA